MVKRWTCKLCLRELRQSEFGSHLESYHNVRINILVNDFDFVRSLYLLEEIVVEEE